MKKEKKKIPSEGLTKMARSIKTVLVKCCATLTLVESKNFT